jgi:hypothetical protein
MLAPVVVKSLATLHAKVPLLQVLLQVLARLLWHGLASRIGVVLLDIMNNVKAHDVHLLKRALWGLQDAPENGVDLLGRTSSLGRG